MKYLKKVQFLFLRNELQLISKYSLNSRLQTAVFKNHFWSYSLAKQATPNWNSLLENYRLQLTVTEFRYPRNI